MSNILDVTKHWLIAIGIVAAFWFVWFPCATWWMERLRQRFDVRTKP